MAPMIQFPYSQSEIKKAAIALSERYRKGITPYLRSPEDRYAYLLTRFPATQAAVARVFQEISAFPIQSLLDIGAGPGTSWDAARQYWNLKQATFVEKDRDFVQIGKQMVPQANWICNDASAAALTPHDVVLFSYSWGEILNLPLLERAWQAAQQFLIIIEPGTPRGYESMLKGRDHCIGQQGKVYAPCPHSRACPWQNTSEWCHFGVRLQRSAEHRQAKEASLSYEDEKFSYVILSKQAVPAPFSRLLKDPLKRKGHTLITLCTENGIEQKTITKKDKELFKSTKKLSWGDKLINII
jgi:ribosomal protein RSM22 (predicted rRNA methylase)